MKKIVKIKKLKALPKGAKPRPASGKAKAGTTARGTAGFSLRQPGTITRASKIMIDGHALPVTECDFAEFVADVSADTSGNASIGIRLAPQLFTFNKDQAAMYDQIQLVKFSAEYVPMYGTAAPGLIVGYYEYDAGDDSDCTTIATAALNAGAQMTQAYIPHIWHWKWQDEKDSQWVDSFKGADSAGTLASPGYFNPNHHRFILTAEGLTPPTSPATTLLVGKVFCRAEVVYKGKSGATRTAPTAPEKTYVWEQLTPKGWLPKVNISVLERGRSKIPVLDPDAVDEVTPLPHPALVKMAVRERSPSPMPSRYP